LRGVYTSISAHQCRFGHASGIVCREQVGISGNGLPRRRTLPRSARGSVVARGGSSLQGSGCDAPWPLCVPRQSCRPRIRSLCSKSRLDVSSLWRSEGPYQTVSCLGSRPDVATRRLIFACPGPVKRACAGTMTAHIKTKAVSKINDDHGPPLRFAALPREKHGRLHSAINVPSRIPTVRWIN
jgi:hypothetical protein